eukprot:GSA25T00027802001.1
MIRAIGGVEGDESRGASRAKGKGNARAKLLDPCAFEEEGAYIKATLREHQRAKLERIRNSSPASLYHAKRKRISSRGGKANEIREEVEEEMAQWVRECNRLGLKAPSTHKIRMTFCALMWEKGDRSYYGSRSGPGSKGCIDWMRKFFMRYDLKSTKRMTTNHARQDTQVR